MIEQKSDHFCGRFSAMASPCELLIETQDRKLAEALTTKAFAEARRIEHKFSRYKTNNFMHQINHSNNKPVAIDAETFRLLEFANTCYSLSNGLFDITSGVLRKAWKFDGSANLPSQQQVSNLLPFIGWQKVMYDRQTVTLAKDMQLDFGGIGKEYAVDRVAKLCAEQCDSVSIVVNFGGDIQVTQPRTNQQVWSIGIESLEQQDAAFKVLQIKQGALATSGDAKRYLQKNGQRYSHILNPKTGYPVEQAARSVTVASQHCIQAGLLATLALLQGADAEVFLQQQGVQFWCYR